MIRLSEILETPDGSRQPHYVGVLVDAESFTPPPEVLGVAFTLIMMDGDIDETLMDVIIAYGLAGVTVILEIPHDIPEVDAAYFMSIAANAGFSISLLPPPVQSPEATEQYHEKLAAFTDAYFQQGNFAEYLYPITSYLEYMFLEVLGGETGSFRPQEEYILERFVASMPEAQVDAFKAFIRDRVHMLFGGAEGFRDFARALTFKIYKQAEDNCREMVRDFEERHQGDAVPAAQQAAS